MNMDAILIILMFAAGLALGAFYFISLWQTVRRLGETENRMRLLAISYVLRLAVVLTAFYFDDAGRPLGETGCWRMIGFSGHA